MLSSDHKPCLDAGLRFKLNLYHSLGFMLYAIPAQRFLLETAYYCRNNEDTAMSILI